MTVPQLLDHTGVPMRLNNAQRPMTRPPMAEVAGVATGIGSIMAPYIGEVSPDPREISRYRDAAFDDLLIYHTYRRTLADEQVYSTLNQRLDAAIAVPWTVKPGGTMRRDKTAAEALKEQLEALDFDKACRQMLFGIFFGYAAGEVIWSMDGARIGIADIRARATDRFRWSRDNELLLRTWNEPLGQPIPDKKFWVLTRPGEHGDQPHGVGLARWCYWPAWMRRNGHRFWAVALERFGSPVPVGTYPKGDMESQAALLKAMDRLSTGSGIAISEGQKLDLLHGMKTIGTGQDAFSSYMDKMISKVILGQSSTTEQGPWRGTAEVQKDVRDEVIASDCRLLGESFTNSVATWFTAWNFPGAAIPQVIRDASPPEDLDKRAEREAKVSQMSGLRPTQAHVQDVYGGEWEQAPQPMAAPGGAPTPPRPGMALAQGEPRDEIDAAVTALLADDGWEPYLDPVIRPLLARVESGDGDLESLRAALTDIFAEMDATELVTTLRQMMFSTNLSGQTPDTPPR